jgi:hypothetical protein
VKFKVKEDASVSIGLNPEQTIRAGVHEATAKNREALEHLESIGLAERVKTADKEA